MTVPSSNSHLKNTTGGAFTDTTEGGTVLGNTSTNTGQITKALSLITNATVSHDRRTLPRALANGLSGNQKALASDGGTFAYRTAGKYVIARSSTTLSGDSDTSLLFMGRASHSFRMDFQHDFGALTLTSMRRNRFSRMGWLNNGDTTVKSRHLWLNAAGTAVALPATLSGTFMYDIADGNASDKPADSAIPTRSIPGELVMKVDFVTLGVSGGDHFDYKAITGM